VKRIWTEEELIGRWTLFPDELALVEGKTGYTRLGFAVMLRFFAEEGRFPRDKHEVPAEVLRFVGEQVGAGPGVGPEGWLRHDWSGRSIKYHRSEIRRFFGFREATAADGEEVASWLLRRCCPGSRTRGSSGRPSSLTSGTVRTKGRNGGGIRPPSARFSGVG